jgi:hypothetical protein
MLQAAGTAYSAGGWATAERVCRRALAERRDYFEALNPRGIIEEEAAPEVDVRQNRHGGAAVRSRQKSRLYARPIPGPRPSGRLAPSKIVPDDFVPAVTKLMSAEIASCNFGQSN